MKTPMQELIEQLYTMYYKALTIETDLSRTGLSNAICLAESMLEKEKQVIIDAHLDAYIDMNMAFRGADRADEYYAKTFNTKEK
jgi:hypothetical protein